MIQWSRIIITKCWPVHQAGDTWIDEPPPPCETPSKRLVRIKAWFDERRGQSLISQKVAGRLLPKGSQVKYIGIRYSHVIDRTVGTSRLRIVGGLQWDAVIYESSESSSQLAIQQCSTWVTVRQNNSELDTTKSSNQSESSATSWSTASEYLTSHTLPSSSEINQLSSSTISQASDILTLAGSHGFLITNPSSLEAFTSLLLLAQSDKNASNNRERSQPNNPDTRPNSQVKENSSAWSSIDAPRTPDLGLSEWETVSCSTGTMKESQDEAVTQPAASTWDNQKAKELPPLYQAGSSCLVSAKFASSNPSTSDWIQVGTSKSNSPKEQREVETSEREECMRSQGEIETLSDPLSTQHSSLTDFNTHPGHKVWEWDVERQRWRKKGGTTEADYFPEVFSHAATRENNTQFPLLSHQPILRPSGQISSGFLSNSNNALKLHSSSPGQNNSAAQHRTR